MHQYLDLMTNILQNGEAREDRTGVGTRSIFGHQMRFDLGEGFPLLTTKKMHTRSIFGELLWFLRGETNVASLHADKITIWDEWADKYGSLGPVYGAQWRGWEGLTHSGLPNVVDQVEDLVRNLVGDPYSRRHILSAWNVTQIPDMALPPCHVMSQFHVSTKGKLSCQLYQRSADVFLGLPFNIASYALLTHLLANVCGYDVGDLVITLGDAHIYNNHVDQVREQLTRTPRELPSLSVSNCVSKIDEFTLDTIWLEDYHPYPAIKAPVAV